MTIPVLSGDLLPSIADPAIDMLLVRLMSLDDTIDVVDGQDVQTGPARFEVLDVIHGRDFSRGQLIVVPVAQIVDRSVRVRNGVNHWNRLRLERGALMVLACPPAPPDALAVANAGIGVATAQGGEVDALRQCYAIEALRKLPDPERWQRVGPLLGAALQSRQDLLFQYALDFSGHREVLGRAAGAMLLERAMAHAGTSAPARREIASHIAGRSRLFDPDKGTDAANVAVIQALAFGLVAEAEPRQRTNWVRFLGSMLLRELAPSPEQAAALRKALVQSVHTPPADRMATVLAQQQDAVQDRDRAMATELLALWR